MGYELEFTLLFTFEPESLRFTQRYDTLKPLTKKPTSIFSRLDENGPNKSSENIPGSIGSIPDLPEYCTYTDSMPIKG